MISIQTSDVESASIHFPGIHLGMIYQIMSQVSGRILSAAVFDSMQDEVEILLVVEVERRHGPMTLGLLRFLFHVEDTLLFIKYHHTRALQLLDGRLFVAHDTTGVFLLCKVDEVAEREKEEVVGG